MKKNEQKQPQYYRSPINNKMLNYKVYYMSGSEKIAYIAGLFVLGGLVGLVFYGGLFKVDGQATLATVISNIVVFCLVGGLATRVLLPVVVGILKTRRDQKLQKQFLDMLECLATSLSSGNTVADSFENAYRDLQNQYSAREMIIVELKEILSGVKNGQTIETMLNDFGRRCDSEDVQNFSNVISNCYRLGGDFANVVRSTRNIISSKIAVADEIETKLMSNKLQLDAMCLMPVVLVSMLKLSSGSFADNLASLTGVIVTTIAIGIFVGAFLWGRKIIDVR